MPDSHSSSKAGIAWGLFVATVVLLLAAAFYVHRAVMDLPQPVTLTPTEMPLTTIVYSADGHEIGQLFRENRRWVPYDDIAPAVTQALVAAEDHRFFRHDGVDGVRLIGAVWRTLWGEVQGGSTITMQLARNFYPEVGDGISLRRKIREVVTATRIEQRFTKTQILEAYLNAVPFGYATFGIEAAAQLYFNRSAAELNVSQAATLVGSLKATTRYNPVRHAEAALARRNVVLARMADLGYLPTHQAASLQKEPLKLDFQEHILTGGPIPYFLTHVRMELQEWGAEHGYDVFERGLRVYTTLDSRLQRVAEESVRRQVEALQRVAAYEWDARSPGLVSTSASRYSNAGKFGYVWRRYPDLVDQHIRHTQRFRRMIDAGADPLVAGAQLKGNASFLDSLRTAITTLQAGLVAIQPKTGHVKAWVGGLDFTRDQYDKVSVARRQPGSTFKPFVYAAAIEAGLSPDYTMMDSAFSYPVSGKVWRPYNFDRGYSGQAITLRQALVQSKNTVSAQLIDLLGPRRVGDVARRMGIVSPLQLVPSLALGTSEVTLLELVSAYGTLAAGGLRVDPVVITHIEDRSGTVIYR
ncbi:MAG: transglycosylase domain-containing protein, partial [Rhodothermales bacterium]